MKKITIFLMILLAISVVACTPASVQSSVTDSVSLDSNNKVTGNVVSEISEKCANCPLVDSCEKARNGGCTGEGHDSGAFGVEGEYVGCGRH